MSATGELHPTSSIDLKPIAETANIPNTADPTPGASNQGPKGGGTDYDGLRQIFNILKAYFNGVVNDVLKPSIATLLDACRANDQVRALLATPILLGSLVFIATLSSLVSLLFVFQALCFFIHMVFKASGVVASTFAWLLTISLITTAISATATTAFVIANVVINFAVDRVQTTFFNTQERRVDWAQTNQGMLAVMDVCKQNFQVSREILDKIWTGLVHVFVQLFSSIQATSLALREHGTTKSPIERTASEKEIQANEDEHKIEDIVFIEDEEGGSGIGSSVEGLRKRVAAQH